MDVATVRDAAWAQAQAQAIVNNVPAGAAPATAVGLGIYLGIAAAAVLVLFGLTIVVKRVPSAYAVPEDDESEEKVESEKSKVESQIKIGGASGSAGLAPVPAANQERVHRALVERDGVVVDVQLDVLRDDRGIHFLRVLSDIFAARVRMRERVFDARAQCAVDLGSMGRHQVAPDRDGGQRQRAFHALLPTPRRDPPAA